MRVCRFIYQEEVIEITLTYETINDDQESDFVSIFSERKMNELLKYFFNNCLRCLSIKILHNLCGYLLKCDQRTKLMGKSSLYILRVCSR